MPLNSISDLKPYSYTCTVRQKWLFFTTTYYHILMEGTVVRTFGDIGDEAIEQIVFLMNAAYQLGYSDGTIAVRSAS